MATGKRKLRVVISKLLAWYAENARDLPWRRTTDPYAILVAEVMLQQTQVNTVVRYWERWMQALPKVDHLARVEVDDLHKLWEGLGYYRRVRNLQRAAVIIVDQHKGKFPTDFDAVLALPGIGRYTAGAVCSIAFNQPTPILDGNVIRVLTRLFGISGNPKKKKTNDQLWQLAETLVQRAALGAQNGSVTRRCSSLNQSLMELGALVCSPRQPRCPACPLRHHCVARGLKRMERFPALPRRSPPIQRRFVAFVLRRGRSYLVRQRPGGVVNGHLWEFPNVELTNGTVDHLSAFREIFSVAANKCAWVSSDRSSKRTECAPNGFEHLCSIKHTITRYRITLEAFELRFPAAKLLAKFAGCWLTPRALHQLAFTSAHKKILSLLTR